MAQESQERKISQDEVIKFLESKDFQLLPPDRKQRIVDHLKSVMTRSAGSGVPDVGGDVMRRGLPGSRMAPIPEEDSKIGGFIERAGDTASGLHSLVKSGPQDEFEKRHPMLRGPVSRAARGFVQAEKTLGGQAKEQFKRGEYARGSTSALAMADPFATASVADINRLEDEGRHQQAIGLGAFDVLSLLAGKSKGARLPTSKRFFGIGESAERFTRANRLTAAAGGGRDAFRFVLPELSETASKIGRPKTVGQLSDLVDESFKPLESKYNLGLHRIAQTGQRFLATSIARRLLKEANDLPTKATIERKMLRHASLEYQNMTKTLSELDKERKYHQSLASSLYSKSPTEQMAASQAGKAVNMDQVIADELRDFIYSEMTRQLGPDFAQLKAKESSLLKLKDQLKDQIEKLADAQGEMEGGGLTQQLGVSLSAHTTGVTPRMHGLMKKLAGGPEKIANRNVRKAFPGRIRRINRQLKTAAIRSMPLDAFMEAQKKDQEDDQK